MTNDDMISRQNVLRCLTDISYNHCKTQGEADVIDTAKTMVAVMSSAQPEIIRCKDCKYCDRGIDEDGNPFLKCLGWVYGGTQEEDFCSHAERRTDGTEQP